MPVVFSNPRLVPAARELDSIEEVLVAAEFVGLPVPGGAVIAKLIDAARPAAMTPPPSP